MKPYSPTKKSVKIIFALLCTVTFFSCQKAIPPIFGHHPYPPPGQPIVLVAGYESKGGNSIAKYWINGQEIILSDGTNAAYANAISASGSDVLIAGQDGGPVYWKNNTEMRLPVTFSLANGSSTANSISVSGNDVYIAGTDSARAVYWKNGIEVILENTTVNGNFGSSANSIFVDGEDIYVAGDHGPNAVYWKNGMEQYLSNLPTGAGGAYRANSIYESDGNIYTTGRAININGPGPIMYWKNGEDLSTILNNNTTALGIGNSIFVSGNNVFIAGNRATFGVTGFNAAYWENGNQTNLPSSLAYSDANAVFEKNNDVYVAGDVNGGILGKAVYWKNGVEVDLTDGTGSASARSIFVK